MKAIVYDIATNLIIGSIDASNIDLLRLQYEHMGENKGAVEVENNHPALASPEEWKVDAGTLVKI